MASSLLGLSALERHHRLLRQGYVSDADAIASAHRFLWDDAELESGHRPPQWGSSGGGDDVDLWEERLAKRYYAKLHREYALADMSRYKEGAVGLRWRTEREVFDGKGQFTCGNKACTADEQLASYEVAFAYREHGEDKHALVKLRVCPGCAEKLHYRKRKEQRRAERRAKRETRRQERRRRKRERRREEEEEEEEEEERRREHGRRRKERSRSHGCAFGRDASDYIDGDDREQGSRGTFHERRLTAAATAANEPGGMSQVEAKGGEAVEEAMAHAREARPRLSDAVLADRILHELLA
jgi:protein FRA10AC1